VRDARGIWQSLHDELLEVAVEEARASILRADHAELLASEMDDPRACLLPGFDVYLLAHANKDHLIHACYYKRVYRNQGWISPVVLLDGRIAGVWSSQQQGSRLNLEIELFEKFSKNLLGQLEKEGESLGTFLGSACRVKFQ